MKLEILSEVKSVLNPKGSTKVCVDVPHSLIQEMADKHEQGDFKQAHDVIVTTIEQVLDLEGGVDEWFNY